MVIEQLRVNHIEQPIGYLMKTVSFSWIVKEAKGTHAAKSRVVVATDEAMQQIVHDSGLSDQISSLDYAPELELQEGVRYYWQVEVVDDLGERGSSAVSFFETARVLERSKWIRAPFEKEIQPLMRRRFTLKKTPVQARWYVCGLGVYEAYLNGAKVGEEYLTPYYNDYNLWLQYQTYDVTGLLREGDNCLGVMLGNGWYKGRFGFVEGMDCLYGDTCHMICELHVTYADGKREVIASDEQWLCAPSPVVSSSIYDGEVYDARKEITDWAMPKCDEEQFAHAVSYEEERSLLCPRLSLPVTIIEQIHPVEMITTPAGETVLDFGQEMTGWVTFTCHEEAGKEVGFYFGEILQEGNFYNENLRSAKAEYHYISNGEERKVRPHFTFYGFRYMKVTGISDVRPEDFAGCVLHSQMEETGSIKTSNPKIDQLISNARWGQKGNFLDVPTDCPQRDERMGWTGDAQVFCQTASYNMYTPAFYRKFLYDMKREQKLTGGSVPHVVPDILGQINVIRFGKDDHSHQAPHGSCAWGDAGTVIPWTMYEMYGDRSLLRETYENMKGWADYIRKVDQEQCGGAYLWTTGFHFADWLALDNYRKDTCFGATDVYFVASAYYYYSVSLTAKAANVLGYEQDAAYYGDLAQKIKAAFLREYYTATGRLAQETQTALAIVLWLDLIPEGYREKQSRRLVQKLEEEQMHLTTGFVGTPLLCPVLTREGYASAAYTLLLNEDFPSWLYEVNMGATTIWERWNSVLPDGKISDTGMNSLNHYAYGSIVEWMYRYMCGLNVSEDHPGFSQFTICPYPDERLKKVSMQYHSAKGLIESGWETIRGGYRFSVTVPFDTEADFIFSSDAQKVVIDGVDQGGKRKGDRVHLCKGSYVIEVWQ
ncbi:MAG: glycoside hydrolase family 78 protein [Lachnospiraceae bacterium]|nr:glycoside hydrolase family 78 protein [Lachnospiraceae bacterium]